MIRINVVLHRLPILEPDTRKRSPTLRLIGMVDNRAVASNLEDRVRPAEEIWK